MVCPFNPSSAWPHTKPPGAAGRASTGKKRTVPRNESLVIPVAQDFVMYQQMGWGENPPGGAIIVTKVAVENNNDF